MMRRPATMLALAAALAGCSGETGPPARPRADASRPSPGVDCARPGTGVERAVCGDARLAGMDREVARLYGLASTGRYMTPERRPELEASQRAWVADRDDCAVGADPERCLTASHALRVHQLRQGYADARSDDERGISTGPFSVRCEGLDALIAATFVNTDPGVVYLEWLNRALALSQEPSGSGAKYGGRADGGEYEFWTQGDSALFAQPGRPETRCTVGEIG